MPASKAEEAADLKLHRIMVIQQAVRDGLSQWRERPVGTPPGPVIAEAVILALLTEGML